MTSVLGFPLADAVGVLTKEGFDVETAEVRSRKGVEDGRDARVIRQIRDGRRVTLFYSVFKTQPNEADA